MKVNEKKLRWELVPAWVWLLLIMTGALALRIVYVRLNPLETRDGIHYMELCRAWYQNGGAALPPDLLGKPVLYQYAIWVLMHLNISAESAGLWLNLTTGTLLLVPVFLMAKMLFNDRNAALAITLLAAVMPPLVEFSAVRLREMSYLFFAAWTFCGWTYGIKSPRHWRIGAVICGAAAGLSTLSRYEGAELILFCGVTLPLAALFQDRDRSKAMLSAMFFVGGLAAGVTVCYLLPGMPDFTLVYLQAMHLL